MLTKKLCSWRKHTIGFLCSLFIIIVTPKVWAFNLLEVYNLAQKNDPTFKAAQASWLAVKENLSISRSALFPQLALTGSTAKRHYDAHGETVNSAPPPELLPYSNDYHSKNVLYSLTLVQPIFNFESWANVSSAAAQVKQAQATYVAAQQSLLLRTATAYFNVLQAKDVLRFTKAKKDAIKIQLEQTKHKYEVGLIAITDYETAQASYDAVTAAEIAAANDVANKLEQLTEIIGIRASDFFEVNAKTLPLLSPQPASIERWVKAGEEQNLDLTAARFAALAARANISAKFAGHLPVINGTASFDYNYTDNHSGNNDFARNKSNTVGISVSLPIFSGGAVAAQTAQAQYQYQQAVSLQEYTHRSVVSQTRQAYLGVIDSISKIKADKQALVSNTSALNSTKEAQSVGTRTMVDVLLAQSALYDAEKNYAQDQYSYIISLLTLKKMAGILDLDDIKQINQWLKSPGVANEIEANIS